MKTLDAHGDDYRNAQLTILVEVRITGNGVRDNVDITSDVIQISMATGQLFQPL